VHLTGTHKAHLTRPFIPTLGQPTQEDNNNEPYVPYYRYLLSKQNEELPQVISNSYGDQEDVLYALIRRVTHRLTSHRESR